MLDFKKKPLIAMLHLKGTSDRDILERMKRETDIYYSNGIDAVLVENYFGNEKNCEQALNYLCLNMPDMLYGVNILGNDRLAFSLAKKYNADFIQIDSVCGHLSPESDRAYEKELSALRQGTDFQLLGGLRFKYQPILSGRSLEEDAALAKKRCDAVVTTGNATGVDCPTEKLNELQSILGSFPLITGAGTTADNITEKLLFSDGAIVGSWLKDGHHASGDVNEEYVKQFVKRANLARI